jgi:hypothetical protein
MGFLVITFELRTVRISFKSNKSWCGCQFLFYYILKKKITQNCFKYKRFFYQNVYDWYFCVLP